jgi:hypothetical protein
MQPGKPPMESTGTCEQKMLLGGRFVPQAFSTDQRGQAEKMMDSTYARKP